MAIPKSNLLSRGRWGKHVLGVFSFAVAEVKVRWTGSCLTLEKGRPRESQESGSRRASVGGNNWFSCPDTQLINHAMGKIEYIAHLLVGAEARTGTLHRVQASHKQF